MKKTELALLRNKCLLFNEFMIENGGVPQQLLSAYEESNKLIENAYRKGDIKPLMAMSADIDLQVSRHMPAAMATRIKKAYFDKLKINLESIETSIEILIEKILKRNKILNSYEYELLLSFSDEIQDSPSHASKTQQIQDILAKYH